MNLEEMEPTIEAIQEVFKPYFRAQHRVSLIAAALQSPLIQPHPTDENAYATLARRAVLLADHCLKELEGA